MSEAPFNDAPYPAASTAAIMLSGLALPSTPIEFVNRLTEQVLTPGTFETAFSTLLLQAAQLMPVTLYCSINMPLSFVVLVSKFPTSTTSLIF